MAVPQHLEDHRCFMCGGEEHPDRTGGDGHKFISNREALAWFNKQPVPDYSPEAAYVAEYRPY